jgi:hypothetical protein
VGVLADVDPDQHLSLCWLLPVHPRLLVDHHDMGSAPGGDPTGSSLDSDGSQVSISGQGAKRTGRPLLPGHTNSKHCIGHTQSPRVSRSDLFLSSR